MERTVGIVDLTDAELSGTARLSDDRLVVTTDWRRFGLSETPARASMRIGRWADDGSAADAVGVAVIHDVAESLEDAGYVTRTIELPLSPHRPFRLTGTSTWGSGRGVLELVANP